MKAGEVTGLHTEKLHMKKCFKLLFLTAYVKTVWRFPTDGNELKAGSRPGGKPVWLLSVSEAPVLNQAHP